MDIEENDERGALTPPQTNQADCNDENQSTSSPCAAGANAGADGGDANKGESSANKATRPSTEKECPQNKGNTTEMAPPDENTATQIDAFADKKSEREVGQRRIQDGSLKNVDEACGGDKFSPLSVQEGDDALKGPSALSEKGPVNQENEERCNEDPGGLNTVEAHERGNKRKGEDSESSAPTSKKKRKESTSSNLTMLRNSVNPQQMASVLGSMNPFEMARALQSMNRHQMVSALQSMNPGQMISAMQFMNPQQVETILQLSRTQQMLSVQQMMNNQHMFNNFSLGQQTMTQPFLQSTQATSDVAAAQKMMKKMMTGGSSANANKSSNYLIPKGFEQLVVMLTLPPPNQKLGICLEDSSTLKYPELRSLASNSPIRAQLPESYHKNSYIVAMRSQAIGYVQPASAKQCASLITKTQNGSSEPIKLELVLIKRECLSPPLPKQNGEKRGRKPREMDYEWNLLKRSLLLDFFSDISGSNLPQFLRGRGKDNLKTSLSRTIQSNKTLASIVSRRDVPARRKEAYDIIENLFPDTPTENTRANRAKRKALLHYFRDKRKISFHSFMEKYAGADHDLARKSVSELAKVIKENEVLCGAKSLSKDDPAKRKEALEFIEKKLYVDALVKEASERADFEKIRKTALLEFFSDPGSKSLPAFCEDNELGLEMEHSMRRFIDRNERLVQIEGKREDWKCREEGIALVEKTLQGIRTKYSANKNQKPDGTGNSKRQIAARFFTPTSIKSTAKNLNFDTRPRMTRDGSKEVAIHDRKSPDELLTLLIFDLSNRVLSGTVLSAKEKSSVLLSCAKVLSYDHGYKKVIPVSGLDRMWESRLEDAYMSGANTAPLSRTVGGSSSYTTKFEKDHPGLLVRLYKYTEDMLGADATLHEKVMFMNEKSIEDNEEDPSLPVLDINKHSLIRWVGQQKLGSAAGDTAQAKPEGDPTIAQIEKKHPGMIKELYEFAIEALGPDASYHMLATCMNERSKEYVEEDPTIPLVTLSRNTLPTWIKKQGLAD